jgi:hypothetical protein
MVVTTSDGIAVTGKFGMLSQIIQPFCYSQVLHLAVTKVLYDKKLKDEASKAGRSGNECDADSEYERDDSKDSDSDKLAGADQYDLQDYVSFAIFSIRKIIKLLK